MTHETEMTAMDRFALVESFKDTQRLIKENPALRDATLTMQAGTRLFLPGFDAVAPVRKSDVPTITVLEDTTFHCAQQYLSEGRVAVLNFANAYSPGGGVTRGAMAQEECLCRSSNLYEGLTLPYLLKNYYKTNARTTGDLGTDALIYHPGVTVFKDDQTIPELLEEPFQVDVITSAAPCLRPDRKKRIPNEKVEDAFNRRIKNILEVAIAYDVDVLVLGAFGCGAFNNTPEMVAGCFRYYLVDREYGCFFKKVVFAIKHQENSQNYAVFERVLSG